MKRFGPHFRRLLCLPWRLGVLALFVSACRSTSGPTSTPPPSDGADSPSTRRGAIDTRDDVDPYIGRRVTLVGRLGTYRGVHGKITTPGGLVVGIPNFDTAAHGLPWFDQLDKTVAVSGILHAPHRSVPGGIPGFDGPTLEVADHPDLDETGEVRAPTYTEQRPEPRLERPRSTEPRPTAPWIDFDRMEMTVFPGIVDYSRDFSAGLSACGGALLRAPTPGVPAPLVDRLRLGGFGELIVSNVDRNFTPELPDPSGATIFVAAGADYTLVQDEELFIRGQGGLMYARFGGVTDLEDGIGVMVGAMGGLAVDQGIWLTYNPQIAFAPDHGDWIMFHLFGIQFQF